jgi:hypothetical protein
VARPLRFSTTGVGAAGHGHPHGVCARSSIAQPDIRVGPDRGPGRDARVTGARNRKQNVREPLFVIRKDNPAHLRVEGSRPSALTKQYHVRVGVVRARGCDLRSLYRAGVHELRRAQRSDSSQVVKCQLIWLDRKGSWARTQSRVYSLGQPAGDPNGG